MLDIHDAHHAATTWREFFIHIATIVLGLLIAIGLEQTVEYLHHRHLASEAHQQLVAERASNETSNDFNIFTTRRHEQDLERDLAILRAVRAHAPRPAGPFIVQRFSYLYMEDEWHKIHQSGTINYLSGNLGAIAYRYHNQDGFLARADDSAEALNHASSMLRDGNDAARDDFAFSLANSQFVRDLAGSHETMSDAALQRGYAALVENADLSKLAPTQMDELERAIQVALVDDDALLRYCYNIKRNLRNNPYE